MSSRALRKLQKGKGIEDFQVPVAKDDGFSEDFVEEDEAQTQGVVPPSKSQAKRTNLFNLVS